jgi:hypothetical protein
MSHNGRRPERRGDEDLPPPQLRRSAPDDRDLHEVRDPPRRLGDGSGEYASIAWCGSPTVILCHTLEEAEQLKAQIDSTACGGRCKGWHEIVRVEIA